jgi:biopolymer transport protein ExbD
MDAGPAPAATARPSPFSSKGLGSHKLNPEDARFDVTPMVDLVFMMNIFFMVSWISMALAEVDLPSARHCTATNQDDAITFTVTAGPGKGCTVHLGGAGPENAIIGGEADQRITAAVEAAQREGKSTVMIKAEKRVLFRDIAHLAAVATGSTIKGMTLTLAVMEKGD